VFAALRSARHQRDITPLGIPLHWISLVAAFAFLLWENRHQWFWVDDWSFIVDRGILGHHFQGLWEPHNEHWSTIPILIYRGLFGVFGIRTYLPYVVVLILLHLLTVHLLWRVLLRSGVTALVAACACAIFAILGSGWENLTWAFQLSVIGSIAMGLAALLVAPQTGAFGRRDVWVWVLAITSLMFSGVGITMVVIVGVITLLRRGIQVAALTIAAPTGAYLVWYATYGKDAPPGPMQESFTTALQAAPAFVWRGLTDAVASTADFAGIGPVVLVLLGLWLIRSVRLDRPPWPTVAATTLGAVVFLALTDIRRSGFGIEYAGTSRYVYVVVALLLPAATLAAASQLDRSNLRYLVLLGFTGLLIFIQMSTLNEAANRQAEVEQNAKHIILASAELLTRREPIVADEPAPKLPSDSTFAEVAPSLQTEELERLARDHKLPGNVAITQRDLNTARAYLQVALSTIALVEPGPVQPALTRLSGLIREPMPDNCVRLTPVGDSPRARFRFATAGTLQVVSSRSGAYLARVGTAEGIDFGQGSPLEFSGGRARVLSVSARDATVELEIPGAGVTTVCGLQPVEPGVLE
jgi:hypothetical protein